MIYICVCGLYLEKFIRENPYTCMSTANMFVKRITLVTRVRYLFCRGGPRVWSSSVTNKHARISVRHVLIKYTLYIYNT